MNLALVTLPRLPNLALSHDIRSRDLQFASEYAPTIIKRFIKRRSKVEGKRLKYNSFRLFLISIKQSILREDII